jgi:hypothetical protein
MIEQTTSALTDALRAMSQDLPLHGAEFEILCVSKRMPAEADFHNPITGIAKPVSLRFGGERYPYRPCLQFADRNWELIGVRTGLAGRAITLIVQCGNVVWDLYTTIPSSDCYSVDDLRERAARDIAAGDRDRARLAQGKV